MPTAAGIEGKVTFVKCPASESGTVADSDVQPPTEVLLCRLRRHKCGESWRNVDVDEPTGNRACTAATEPTGMTKVDCTKDLNCGGALEVRPVVRFAIIACSTTTAVCKVCKQSFELYCVPLVPHAVE